MTELGHVFVRTSVSSALSYALAEMVWLPAASVDVSSGNGSCGVVAGSPKTISVSCDNGDMTASLDGIAADSQGGSFTTGNGSIDLAMPSGKFNVQAVAHDGGKVNTAKNADCTVAGDAPDSKTVSCGGATTADPIYKADANGTGLADVNLSF